jgi:hypothetical protein
MIVLTRTLAAIGVGDSAERTLALHRWDTLASELKRDPYFAGVIEDADQAIKAVRAGKQSPAELSRVKRAALELGRGLKNQISASQNATLIQELKRRRQVEYDTIRLCAQKIVEMLSTKSFADAEGFIKEFWTMYWGELALFEGSRVASTMVGFGEELNRIAAAIEKDLPPDLKKLMMRDESEPNTSQEFMRRVEQIRWQQGAEQFSRVVSDLTKRKVPEPQMQALRDKLKDLVSALDAELKEGIGGSSSLPSAY